MRFTAKEKMELIRLVEQSEWSVRRTLKEIGIHKSTFYNWYKKYRENGIVGLEEKKSTRKHYWNKIPDRIRSNILNLALEVSELSCRELACRYTDENQYFISESSGYRILKSAGLINPPHYDLISAADEFKDKTTTVNQMWQTDFTYFKIIGWGWYYLSTILDDYSRYIISWELCSTMKTLDVKNTLNQALNHPNVNLNKPPKLLSDNGSCYLSQELSSYLDDYKIKHVRGRPGHPQTQGKIERYHRTMKNVIKLDHYYSPGELSFPLSQFVKYYNHHRYHESLQNLIPADVYYGLKEEKLKRRKLCKHKTFKKRRQEYFNLTFKSVT